MVAFRYGYRRRSFQRVIKTTADVPLDLAEALWHDPRQVLALGKPLQARKYRSIVRVDWGNQAYALKHYCDKRLIDVLKQSIRPSRAWQTWQSGLRLVELGIPTPQPAAIVENVLGPCRATRTCSTRMSKGIHWDRGLPRRAIIGPMIGNWFRGSLLKFGISCCVTA
jgi:hypothetical protein